MSERRRNTQWRPVDRVAFVLAIGLSATIILILIVTCVQILSNKQPEVQLSENATQVMIAGLGGLTGLLGAYVGLNRSPRGRDDDDEDGNNQ
jgi:hypothetical protein